MMQTRFFNQETVEKVFKIECYQKTDDIFLKTHVPLTLRYRSPGQGRDPQEIVENTLLKDWKGSFEKRKASDEPFRPYVIWGVPGTGKTELCRLLEIEIQKNPAYLVKRISKRDLTQGGILSVASALSEEQADFSDKIGQYSVPELVEYFKMPVKQLIRKYHHEELQQLVTLDQLDDIALAISQSIAQNLKYRVAKVDEADEISGDLSQINSEFEFFSRGNAKYIRQTYGLGLDQKLINKQLYLSLLPLFAESNDFRSIILNYIKRVNDENKIPVIIFDDVTQLTSFIDELITLITDISGTTEGHLCDFIVGTTSKFYREKFTGKANQTIKERIYEIQLGNEEVSGRSDAQWLTSSNGRANFYELVTRYLNATYIAIPDITSNQLFTQEEMLHYPLTRQFINNLYSRFFFEVRKDSEKSFTPREVIRRTREMLEDFTKTGKAPSTLIDNQLTTKSRDLFIFKDPAEENLKKIPDLLEAIWYYGLHSDEEDLVSFSLENFNHLSIEPKLIPRIWEGKTEVDLNLKKMDVVHDPDRIIGGVVTTTDHDLILRSNIREWLKGNKNLLAVDPLIYGFNRVLKILNDSLPGKNNNYRFILNPVKLLDSDIRPIEYKQEGKKECDFMFNQIDGGLHSIIITDPENAGIFEKEIEQKPYCSLIVLDEEAFFQLYKIGDSQALEQDKQKVLKEFIESNHSVVTRALQKYQAGLREDLKSQLHCDPETYVLSSYLLLAHLFKPGCVIQPVEKIEDIIHLFRDAGPTSKSSHWPDTLQKVIHSDQEANNYREVYENLFRSFFFLRGETIIDGALLQKSWDEIKESPFKPVQEVIKVDLRFLVKTKNPFNDYVKKMISLVTQINDLKISLDFNYVRDLREKISMVKDKKTVPSLNKVVSNLEGNDGQPFFLKTQIKQIENLQNIDKNIAGLTLILDRPNIKRNNVQSVAAMISVNTISEDPAISLINNIENTLDKIERDIGVSDSKDVERLKKEISTFISLKGVIYDNIR